MESLPKPTKSFFVIVIAIVAGIGWFQASQDNRRVRELNGALIAQLSKMQSAGLRQEINGDTDSTTHGSNDNEESLFLPPGPAQELPEFLLQPMNLQRATNYDRRQLILPPVPEPNRIWLYRGSVLPMPETENPGQN